MLEDRLSGAVGRLYHDPIKVIRCEAGEDVNAAFAEIEGGMADGFHAAGFMSYELTYALEPRLTNLMPERREAPLMWMGLYNTPRLIEPHALDDAFAALGPPPPITTVNAAHDRSTHIRKVDDILRLIAAGDAYQVNLTFPLHFHYDGDPLQLYAALRARQPVRYGGIAALDDCTVLSVSPELWVAVNDDQARTRPMKGTTARGSDPEIDRIARDALRLDPKQRAENLMIVDLLRNDLARVSAPGSVRVPDLFTVETYPGFHALTSTITARINPDQSLKTRVAALFPCGSIVGAPKIRAAEIIRDLEPDPRGAYTGALGAVQPKGDMTFNVAIRTAYLKSDGVGRYGVGGGVVADSDGDAEYDEALLKGRILTDLSQVYDLIETFRWSSADGFIRLPLHLDRMASSARRLGFSFNRRGAKAALDRLARTWTPATGDQRIRLALRRDGALDLTFTDAVAGRSPLRLCIARDRLDPADPFLRHKTSRREVYEVAFADAVAAGFDEAVLLNRKGQVAEASRHTIFAKVGDRLVTPPLNSGVLPGVLRQFLISEGKVTEQSLTLGDLKVADHIFLGNSLHGLRSAVIADSTDPADRTG